MSLFCAGLRAGAGSRVARSSPRSAGARQALRSTYQRLWDQHRGWAATACRWPRGRVLLRPDGERPDRYT